MRSHRHYAIVPHIGISMRISKLCILLFNFLYRRYNPREAYRHKPLHKYKQKLSANQHTLYAHVNHDLNKHKHEINAYAYAGRRLH